MAWSNNSNVLTIAEDATTPEANHAPVPTISPFPFDARMHIPAVKDIPVVDEVRLAELAQNAEKTTEQLEQEKKEKLLWSIAENRLLSETARVSALRLLHEIQVFRSGTAELLDRIQQLEAKLLKKRSRTRPVIEEG